MLRLSLKNKQITFILKKEDRILTWQLLQALLLSLFIHTCFFALFKIKPNISETALSLHPISVSIDLKSPKDSSKESEALHFNFLESINTPQCTTYIPKLHLPKEKFEHQPMIDIEEEEMTYNDKY